MKVTSRTGLIASKTNKLLKEKQPPPIQLQVVATSAPYVLKPYAGLYSPYPYSCSLLCNHPADDEARELVKKAKDTWATEGKNILLAEEIEAIKASFNVKVTDYDDLILHENGDQLPLGCVPEELFRRYTETDSRPLTPVPTLASAHNRASGSRRCVTPDPMSGTQVREKTLLVLDLRRSHSQETISWHSSSLQQREDLPSITIVKATAERRAVSALNFSETSETPRKKKDRSNTTPSPTKLPKIDVEKTSKTLLSVTSNNPTDDENETTSDDEDVIKRRGKKRRKRGRDLSHDPPGIQSAVDPETQIETIGPDSHNPSARPSLVPDETIIIGEIKTSERIKSEEIKLKVVTPKVRRSSLSIDSFLDIDSLKLLRRELNEEVIDNEFNFKRRRALKEALKTVRSDKPVCDEMLTVQSELVLVPIDDNIRVNIPRTFSRSSARFELPNDSRKFNTMTPLEYVNEHVSVSTSRKQLYNFIFNRNKIENELEIEHQPRLLSGTSIETALNEMMGKNMSEQQMNKFRDLIGWKDEDVLDFKTFCGLCALCERILAPEYYSQLPNRKSDPCHEIEAVDFQSLDRRLSGQHPDERLVKILYAIKDL